MNRTIGQRIRTARKQAGLTQAELGKRLGITPQAVTKWEGDDTAPTRENVIAIARETNVAVQWLLLQEQEVNGTIPAWVDGGRSVPMSTIDNAVQKLRAPDTDRRVFAHFQCGRNAFGVELLDDSNAPNFAAGSRWIVDPDQQPTPGKMVVAAAGDTRRAVLGEYIESATSTGIVRIVRPLNQRWAEARSDLESLDIVAVMTEAISRG